MRLPLASLSVTVHVAVLVPSAVTLGEVVPTDDWEALAGPGTTVTRKLRVIVSMPPFSAPPLSRTDTVIVAVPSACPSGWRIRLPEASGLEK